MHLKIKLIKIVLKYGIPTPQNSLRSILSSNFVEMVFSEIYDFPVKPLDDTKIVLMIHEGENVSIRIVKWYYWMKPEIRGFIYC